MTKARRRVRCTARLRDEWLASPYPLLVEHRGDDHQICAAPSLWMGARSRAMALREAGLRPGDRLGLDDGPGIDFVQWLIACLRTGVVFAPATRRPQAVARPDGRIERRRTSEERAAPDAVVAELEDGRLERADVDTRMGAPREMTRGVVLFSAGAWRTRASVEGELLPALRDGAELHVGAVAGAALSLPDCRPELVVGPARALDAWRRAGVVEPCRFQVVEPSRSGAALTQEHCR